MFDRHRSAGLLATPGREIALFRHHDLAAEQANDSSILLVSLGLDVDHAPVVLRSRFPLIEHRCLAVDGVAVKGRRDVAQRLDFEVGDRLTRDVWYRHAEQNGVDEVADDHVFAELGGVLGVVGATVPWIPDVDRSTAIVDCAVYRNGAREPGNPSWQEALEDVRRTRSGFLWIGLHEPTERQLAGIAEAFDLHPLAVEDAVHAHQ